MEKVLQSSIFQIKPSTAVGLKTRWISLRASSFANLSVSVSCQRQLLKLPYQ